MPLKLLFPDVATLADGTLIATVVLVLLPELLRSLQDYRMLIYAIALILIMLLTNNDSLKTWLKQRRRNAAGRKEV